MTRKSVFVRVWLAGLAAFAITIALGAPLAIDGVPHGILDHQSAGSAAEVNRIQGLWEASGLTSTARNAMIADLVFIGIFGTGCVLGGLHYRRAQTLWLALIGYIALVSGVLFLANDYAETIVQFIQLVAGRGYDSLAQLAAFCQPIKVVSFILAFGSILVALVVEPFVKRAA
ncbi:MAG: hypothetical protein AAF559_01270 [Pseudomonadota bacterium]